MGEIASSTWDTHSQQTLEVQATRFNLVLHNDSGVEVGSCDSGE